jgi:elongation factor G
VQGLLDAIVDYLPSPLDKPKIWAVEDPGEDLAKESHSKGARVFVEPKLEAPFAALAFKVMNDPYVGQVTFIRVYSGRFSLGDTLYNSGKKKKEKPSRLLQMHANKREDIQGVGVGEIAAVVGFKFSATGDTLCDERAPVLLEKIDFPEPVISVVIEPKTRADEEKLGQALSRLQLEDPSFQVRVNEETGQMLLYGMGELHLEILIDRMKREFKTEANVGKPQVSYRETILTSATGFSDWSRLIGAKVHQASFEVWVEPIARGAGVQIEPFGLTFENNKKTSLFNAYSQAILTSFKEVCQAGVMAGYSLIDVRIVLKKAIFEEESVSEMAFKVSSFIALRDAFTRGGCVILEPIFRCEIVCPAEYMGAVIGDLTSRRGKIQSMTAKGNNQLIHAFAPLSEMFGYSTALRSVSQGRASYTMEFSNYEPVSSQTMQSLRQSSGMTG